MEKTSIPTSLKLVLGHEVMAVLLGEFIIEDERMLVVYNLEDRCIESFDSAIISHVTITTAGEVLNSPLVHLLKRDLQQDLFAYMSTRKKIMATANINNFKEPKTEKLVTA
jgi:hypothetical protein